LNILFKRLIVLCLSRMNGFGLRFWNFMRKRGYGV